MEAFSKSIQRSLNYVDWRGEQPLEKCPLQFGCSDMVELAVFGDSCCNGVGSFTEMMGRACSCGQISFKNHKHKDSGVGDQIPEELWHDLLLHNLKQLAMKRFLGGGIERVLRGHLESTTTNVVQKHENTKLKAHKFRFGEGVQVDCQRIRSHMVFIYEERRVDGPCSRI